MTTSSPKITHLDFLQKVRSKELSQVLTYFPSAENNGTRRAVLEIGAGTGQQAKTIKDLGYDVTAIDIPSSHYYNDRIFDVIDYDGRAIPVATGSIDVVFSSTVLEHVREIDDLLQETIRIMAKDAIAVHVLPTSAWRLWGIVGHYLWLIRRMLAYTFSKVKRRGERVFSNASPRKPTSLREWLGTFFPLRHGERGVTVTEAYYYSRYWWKRKFSEHGLRIIKIEGNHIFYSSANALGVNLNIKIRTWLSYLFGSACNIYVLKRDPEI
ncbi:class I SAM-dependent methyltransferase [Dyella monticola]|uniref:Class I SAM-dependent methyltransferase n=1 Tax=Dyella monticola TaxID=1927958 RepID=A0A370X7W2_9GAMM|nr:class I SAM-dependent methyltransferase [Dyella monticola]RDS84524.1 class I SAM-dependent methyltransferase [Dyella monticola]